MFNKRQTKVSHQKDCTQTNPVSADNFNKSLNVNVNIYNSYINFNYWLYHMYSDIALCC